MVISQNNCQYKTFLGDEQWGEVDGIKHREKRLPLNAKVFEKEVIFQEFDFETSDLELEVLNQPSKRTQLYYLASSMTE